MPLPSLMETLWRQKSDPCSEFSGIICIKSRHFFFKKNTVPKTQTRVNFGKAKATASFAPQVPLSVLTTSAMSSMPFLEVANSLLGRMESRTVWGGRLGSGASMSPMAEERRCRRSSGLTSTGKKKVTVSPPNKANGGRKKNDVGAWGFFYEVETETMMTARKRAKRKKESATSAFCMPPPHHSRKRHKETNKTNLTHTFFQWDFNSALCR